MADAAPNLTPTLALALYLPLYLAPNPISPEFISLYLLLPQYQLSSPMLPTEFTYIFYLFDTDGSGSISLDKLQAASRELGNPKSAEELVATVTYLQVEPVSWRDGAWRDRFGRESWQVSPGSISLPQFLKVL